MDYKGPIYDKSFEFSLLILELYQKLIYTKQYDIGRQILRSGTSIGANTNEAGAAESRKDFIHKMSIALKEARETKYWLRLLHHSQVISMNVDKEMSLVIELNKILTSIVKTTQQT